jgi:hypothetical protein
MFEKPRKGQLAQQEPALRAPERPLRKRAACPTLEGSTGVGSDEFAVPARCSPLRRPRSASPSSQPVNPSTVLRVYDIRNEKASRMQ